MSPRPYQRRLREEILIVAERRSGAAVERCVLVRTRSSEELVAEAPRAPEGSDEADAMDVGAGEAERAEPRVIGVHWLVAIDWPSGGRSYRNAQRRASFRAEATRYSSRSQARAERRALRRRCRGGRVRVVRVVATAAARR